MRLWSIHPSYLDTKGLLAAWREGLLAQSVINKSSGSYRNHPQLNRFKATENPPGLLGFFLVEIVEESLLRNYKFNKDKIQLIITEPKIPVTSGQVNYEFSHLKNKLKNRDPERYNILLKENAIKVHPLFYVVEGPIENWEKI
jgi:hypothetical protein